MRKYNSRYWLSLIFKLRKGDTINILWPGMITVALYTAGVVYIERNIFDMENSAVIHSLIAFVISLLLVFRTNTAYERWWEGRIMWGNMTTHIRNLSFKINALIPADRELQRAYFFMLFSNFPIAVKDLLRNQSEFKNFRFGNGFEQKTLEHIEHIPNKILALCYDEMLSMRRREEIDSTQLRIVDIDLSQLSAASTHCERIKSSPIPKSYSMFIRKFLFLYILTLPFGFGETLGYYLAPIVSFVFYVLLSLELIAASIEDPFGKDSEDLPLENLCMQMRRESGEILNIDCSC